MSIGTALDKKLHIACIGAGLLLVRQYHAAACAVHVPAGKNRLSCSIRRISFGGSPSEGLLLLYKLQVTFTMCHFKEIFVLK